jgi:hypothetical protein
VTQDELATLRNALAGRRLGPALGWPAVHTFEAAYSLVLPEPYRSFLAEVGDGCPDGPPAYGWSGSDTRPTTCRHETRRRSCVRSR